MPELRHNPFLDTWTMVATNRQHRPDLPKTYCPFCPSDNPNLPAYEFMAYPNDFPALSVHPQPTNSSSKLLKSAPAYGVCEVILYSPEHHKVFYELSEEHIQRIIGLWQKRQIELAKDKKIKYIFPFENKGEEVGVTMSHPHGQLYAYSWIPSKLKTEYNQCLTYFKKHRRNLFDDWLREEIKQEKRIVTTGKHFTAVIPYFTDYPFGLWIVANDNISSVAQLTEEASKELAQVLKNITRAFDQIYDRPFPYMMCVHQQPVNSPRFKQSDDWYRLHIEFYPPLRGSSQIKWYAGSEMGAGAAANPLSVEDCAAVLRKKLTP